MTSIDELKARYHRAAHAMQAGVAVDQGRGSQDGSPKHLRVGVNSALLNDAAMVRLLMDKGIITEEEYWTALVQEFEDEVRRYEELLQGDTKTKIKLF